LEDHVPEVPDVPEVPPKDVPEVPEVPHVPAKLNVVWQNTYYNLPNNIGAVATGEIL
jgi:hypothetical protein